jgi:hypothetical protein
VEEEHANNAVIRLINPEEVDQGILEETTINIEERFAFTLNLQLRRQRSHSTNACVDR